MIWSISFILFKGENATNRISRRRKAQENTSTKYYRQPEIYVEGVCLRRINRGLNNEMKNLN